MIAKKKAEMDRELAAEKESEALGRINLNK
jgi:hypothetical protein